MPFERERFEAALQIDRFDEATRRIFADWLEENGFDDEAVFQRKWTRVWQEAHDGMEEIAKDSGGRGWGDETDGDWSPITVEDLIEAGHEWVKNGECWTQYGKETLQNELPVDLFWKYWEILTEQEVPEDKKHNPFSCSC